jgi:hypothetical protein
MSGVVNAQRRHIIGTCIGGRSEPASAPLKPIRIETAARQPMTWLPGPGQRAGCDHVRTQPVIRQIPPHSGIFQERLDWGLAGPRFCGQFIL